MAFVTSAALPRSGLCHNSLAVCAKPANTMPIIVAPLEIQAAKHVQFKAAKKAERCRPRKHRPSDINRKPPPFNPEPLRAEGVPEEYSITKAESPEAAAAALEEAMAVLKAKKESGEEFEPVRVPAVEPVPYKTIDINELDLPSVVVG